MAAPAEHDAAPGRHAPGQPVAVSRRQQPLRQRNQHSVLHREMAALAAGIHANGALGSYPLTLDADRADGRLRELQSGHGLVVDVRLDSLAELARQLDDRDQTLVQHGFSREALVELLDRLGNRALDRIVPFGRALDFHPVWDGTDLLDVLTRKITLPGN